MTDSRILKEMGLKFLMHYYGYMFALLGILLMQSPVGFIQCTGMLMTGSFIAFNLYFKVGV